MKIVKSTNSLVLALALSLSAPLVMAAGKNSDVMNHDHTVGDGHQVMIDLLKTGQVLRVSPLKDGEFEGGKIRTYQIIIKTPDGVTHSVDFRGEPVGINNG
ncbi:MAG: hypothetical protein CMK99_22335 [Pseudomonas sp.]|jgi:hypothetical protein|uniref:Secreted protein n=1 Tax=Pseudomonas knackmussii TaxID=65741 RepID=A0ABY4KKN4_9PSED|nr:MULTISPECIES: hypothetical protein [Pseudomonadaceae]MAX93439.1 hypothetical protein [Pseudomonas sp.]UPQ81361.1 hypothetical protein M0M42_13105 [Pseudomonas knackmussii]HBS78416.1 hypothetical protein [Pseudomonas sp.]|tara:strand:- start:1528 stop:1830 length:303 start_codon:yes stop_codon:yes gene_type:complete